MKIFVTGSCGGIMGWSKSEVKYLKENYGKLPAEKIANELGRSVGAVELKALRLELKLGRGYWRKWSKRDDINNRSEELREREVIAIPPRKEWLKQKYWEENLSTTEIAKICDVAQTTVYNWMVKYDIPRRPRPKSKLNLSPEHLEIIEGELLGDGHITERKNGNSRFELGSTKREHLEHIISVMSKNVFPGGIKLQLEASENNENFYRIRSRRSSDLTKLRERWYPYGEKRLPPEFKLTPTKAHYWYISDGKLNRKCPFLSSVKLSEDYLVKLKEELSENGITDVALHEYKSNRGLYIRSSSSAKFFKWIGKPKVKAYSYKWPEELFKCVF